MIPCLQDVQNEFVEGGDRKETLIISSDMLLLGVLDEPTSALERSVVWEVEELIPTLIPERELACLIVTHYRE